MRWTVVIPAKSLPAAKSRLVPASVDAEGHRRLVEAIRIDTASAALAAEDVARVLVVADGDTGTSGVAALPGVTVIRQSAPGLNGALDEAAALARDRWPDDAIAALVGDLAALEPAELSTALRQAAGHPRAFVPDSTGTGTTLLTALPGIALAPGFGADSARRHARDGVELAAGPGLRTDIDTAADLDAASGLGVGPATGAVLSDVGIARPHRVANRHNARMSTIGTGSTA